MRRGVTLRNISRFSTSARSQQEFLHGVPVHPELGPDFRADNFSAGPSAVPMEVLREAQSEFTNFRGTGIGMMEMSHRDAGGPVQNAIEACTNDMRELLQVPDTHHVLFLQGGAVGQFSFLPMNFLNKSGKADFLDTGFWSARAALEAAKYGDAHKVLEPLTDMQVKGETKTVPEVSQWDIREGTSYVHLCANETISGVEFLEDPTMPEGVELVGDFTSTLLSRPVDISKYGCIIASHGKNLGPAGICTVIVKDSWLRSVDPHPFTPAVFDYRQQADSQPLPSLVNTPPTFTIYMAGKVFRHYLEKGGTQYLQNRAETISGMIYDVIDNSNGFYTNEVDPKYRSRMTIPLRIREGDRELEKKFEAEGAKQGLLQLCGHPWFGGLRVTLYNGIPKEGAYRLETFMKWFAEKYA